MRQRAPKPIARNRRDSANVRVKKPYLQRPRHKENFSQQGLRQRRLTVKRMDAKRDRALCARHSKSFYPQHLLASEPCANRTDTRLLAASTRVMEIGLVIFGLMSFASVLL